MGNSSSQKAADAAKNRRYSRSSGFAHWMDNVKDKKTLKINMKQTSPGRGSFTLIYTDSSSDDFVSIKSTFTFSGSYSQVGSHEEADLFGVSIKLNPRGNVVSGDAQRDKKQDRHPSIKQVKKSAEQIDDSKDSMSVSTPGGGSTITRTTRFLTEKLVCKLTEDSCTQTWTIVPSTLPDCLEKTASEIERRVSWEWTDENGLKVHHSAPPGTLDFVGEETFEGGTSYLDLKIRIPQLQNGLEKSVVCLNEVGGWKLGK